MVGLMVAVVVVVVSPYQAIQATARLLLLLPTALAGKVKVIGSAGPDLAGGGPGAQLTWGWGH